MAYKGVPTNPGKGICPKYRSIVKPDGQIELVQDGVRDLYDEIQSHADECDLNVLMRRYAAGDVNALGSAQGFFADIMDLPQTRQEMLQSIMDAEAAFAELPNDIREMFGQDWRKFYIEAGTEGFAAKLGLGKEESSPTPEPEPTGEVKE